MTPQENKFFARMKFWLLGVFLTLILGLPIWVGVVAPKTSRVLAAGVNSGRVLGQSSPLDGVGLKVQAVSRKINYALFLFISAGLIIVRQVCNGHGYDLKRIRTARGLGKFIFDHPSKSFEHFVTRDRDGIYQGTFSWHHQYQRWAAATFLGVLLLGIVKVALAMSF